MPYTRRGFLATVMTSLGAGLLYACGGSSTDTPAPTGGDCQSNGTSVAIASNHGHTLTVDKVDVAAGTEKTYDFAGSAPHVHSVVVTAADFTKLQDAKSITVTSSSTASHTHSVTIGCA